MNQPSAAKKVDSYDLWDLPFVEEKIFPSICSVFGGAERVKFTKTKARIKLPDSLIVEVPRSQLPDPSQWTAFSLADFVHKQNLS